MNHPDQQEPPMVTYDYWLSILYWLVFVCHAGFSYCGRLIL